MARWRFMPVFGGVVGSIAAAVRRQNRRKSHVIDVYSAWDASTKHIGMSICRTSKLYLTQTRPRCIPLRCKMFVGLVLLRSDYGQSEPCCEDTFSNQRKSGAIRLHVWRISDL